MILLFDINFKELYLSELNKTLISVYWVIIAGLMSALVALPFVYMDVSVKSSGIIRPLQERTEIKSSVNGVIEAIYFTEGQLVPKGAVILKIKDNNTDGKKNQISSEIAQHEAFIHDLQLLSDAYPLTRQLDDNLLSPLYKQQLSQFLSQQNEHLPALSRLNQEVQTLHRLAKQGAIALKEYKDKDAENQRAHAAYEAATQEQLSNWQQDLVRYDQELSQLQAQQDQLQQDAEYCEVKAPVRGTLQGFYSRYTGGLLQAGEIIASLSPETDLVAECYVSTSETGLLKNGQEVKFQVDAFNYNYFGIATGRVLSIDNDFTLVENRPVFKVRCAFNQNQLYLKNGFTGHLKKGLTVQARFTIARRSLWKLLFDKVDDWVNPSKA